MARALLILLLWALQATLIVLLVDDGWVEREFQAERALVAKELGDAKAERLQANAENLYRRCFVDTGWVSESYSVVVPDPASTRGHLNLAPWAFRWVGHRLDAMWWLEYQALYRLLLLGVWMPYMGTALLISCIDGLVRRRIERDSGGYASGDTFLVARAAALLLIMAPLFYLSAPLSVPPVLVPLGGVFLCIASNLYTRNLQYRI